jgi:hypothetical protein
VEQWFYETKVLRNDGPDEGMVVCFGGCLYENRWRENYTKRKGGQWPPFLFVLGKKDAPVFVTAFAACVIR